MSCFEQAFALSPFVRFWNRLSLTKSENLCVKDSRVGLRYSGWTAIIRDNAQFEQASKVCVFIWNGQIWWQWIANQTTHCVCALLSGNVISMKLKTERIGAVQLIFSGFLKEAWLFPLDPTLPLSNQSSSLSMLTCSYKCTCVYVFVCKYVDKPLRYWRCSRVKPNGPNAIRKRIKR